MKLILCLLALVSSQAFASSLIRSLSVTPVITGDAYAQGDQIWTYTELDGIALGAGIHLKTLTLVDQAKVKHDLQILFWNAQPTLASADNAAVSFTDAVASANFIGRIALAEADYVDTASNSQVTKALDLLLATKGSRDLFFTLVCVDSGGCDYAAVTDLVLRFSYFE